MDKTHSDRACSLCRQRRVKCDKTLPTCQRCSKLGQPCPGYPSKQRFVDQGSLVRKKLAEEASESAQRSNSNTASPRSFVNESQSHVSQKRLRNIVHSKIEPENLSPVSFAPIHGNHSSNDRVGPQISSPSNSYANATQTQSIGIPSTSPLQYEPFHSNDLVQSLPSDFTSEFFDLDIDTYYAAGTNACGFFPGIGGELPQEDDEVNLLNSMDYTNTQSFEQTLFETVADSYNKKEMALLMQLFVDFLAPWMDLLDINAYFSRVLPLDAGLNILLQSALAAVAAKQTARHIMNGHAKTATKCFDFIVANYHNVSSNEWFYKAACYYDRGISHLRACLQRSSSFVAKVLSPQSYPSATSPLFGRLSPSSSRDGPSPGYEHTDVQHLFSAISVLSMYESLDDCFTTSSQHLPGFLALFGKNNTPSLPRSLSAGRASFWYFARKEALTSYAHHTKPRIDPEDVATWLAAGLPPGVYHFMSNGTSAPATPNAQNYACEESEALPYTLIWILTKVIDLIASQEGAHVDHLPHVMSMDVYNTSSPGSSTDEQPHSRRSTWVKLRELLQHWYDNRSSLLKPYASTNANHPFLQISNRPVKMSLFSSATGAAALQLYHFIQMLLLINQPTNRRDQGSRLRMLKDNSIEVEHHSREICAIALGHQPFAIQRQMSHPLQLAGAHFETKEDRDLVVEILRQVASETSSPIDLPS